MNNENERQAKAGKSPESPLERFESTWTTDLGVWIPGQGVVFRGRDLFNELAPLPWMELLMLGITGRRFAPEQVELFEQMWAVSASYPDPRIWNNRVAALGGTARSTAALAVGAATAVTQAHVYGGQADFGAIGFILRACAAVNDGRTLDSVIDEQFRAHRRIPGYGRPIVAQDERIVPLLRIAENLGLADGQCVRIAREIEQRLVAGRKRMRMNIAGLAAALAADQGVSPREYQAYVCLAFGAGLLACYTDAAGHPEGGFFPWRCASIAYQGPPPRAWD
jgi:hypothetical protein